MARRTLAERFWEKVDVKGPDDCWPWKAHCNRRGYGQFWADGFNKKAHRVAYEQTRGELAPGMKALHTCDNPPCCNPGHLFEGTDADNGRDKSEKGRAARNTGETNGSCTIPDSVVLEIITRRASGMSLEAAGKPWGVRRETVHKIVTGKRRRRAEASHV